MANVKLSKSEVSRILDAIPDTYYRTDISGKILFLSSSVEFIFGYKPYEVTGKPITDFYVNAEDRDLFLKSLQDDGGRTSGFECKMYNKQREEIWVSTSAWYVKDIEGNITGVEGLTREITQSKQLAEILRKTSESYKKLFEEHFNILEFSPGGIVKIDDELVITYMNPAMEEILGVPKNQKAHTIGMNLKNIPSVGEAGFMPALEKLLTLEPISVEGPFKSIYGKSSFVSIKGVPYVKDGKFGGAVFLATDITKLNEMADTLRYQASHDSLTGLINRRAFEQKLKDAMASAKSENTEHALCYVDLDQFKTVNDTCGHLAGDDLLRQLAPVLEEAVGEGNLLARLGGDEFGIIYYGINSDKGLENAENLLRVVQEFRFQSGEKIFEIGASIGLAPIRGQSNTLSDSLSDLLAAADSACYLAKEQGRNRIQVYTEHDNALQIQKHHMQWFQKLNRAIEENRFIVYFQPINTIGEEVPFDVVGEFLVRMVGEDQSIISPMVFIPTAERYQLMSKIDRYVIEEVFSLLSLKPPGKPGEVEKVFTINLSAQSICMSGFYDFVKDEFSKHGISPRSICFEITETAVITNMAEALKFIHKLKEFGCLFALDDFGSGMSSLTHLKKIPVDFVKIDGSFIMSMRENPADMVMVKSVVDISRVMKLKTIAENVEDEETADQLKTMGVDYTQGFFHGKPKKAKNNELLR
jgi:diguanylate cyclase (GGDEF)-like protein/PAS domain S-box-containing protein